MLDDHWVLRVDAPDVKLELVEQSGTAWVCDNCSATYLHGSGGVCSMQDCKTGALSERDVVPDSESYYGWLAQQPVRRMRVASSPVRPASTSSVTDSGSSRVSSCPCP